MRLVLLRRFFFQALAMACVGSAFVGDCMAQPVDRAGDAPSSSTNQVDKAAWIASRAVALDDEVAVRAALGRIVDGAKLVGIGEATHGSGNVFLARGRMSIALIEHHGFDTVLLEAPAERCELMARYVAGEDIDPRKAIGELFYWCWQNEELLQSFTMLREWNLRQKAAGSDRRVIFGGFDVFPARRAQERATRILDQLDAAAAAEFRTLVGRLHELPQWQKQDPRWGPAAADLQAFCEGLRARLEKIAAAKPDEIERAVTSCFNCHASLAYAASGEVPIQTVRDTGMVRNVVREVEGKGRRAVLWAHNAHLERNPDMLGGMLAARFGPEYRIIGSVVGGGTCTALRMQGRSVVKFPLAESPEGSLERAWHRAGAAGLLDIRASRWGNAAAWLAEEIPARMDIGFFEMPKEYELTTYRYQSRFDALFFLPESTPSTPTREWPNGVPMQDWSGDE